MASLNGKAVLMMNNVKVCVDKPHKYIDDVYSGPVMFVFLISFGLILDMKIMWFENFDPKSKFFTQRKVIWPKKEKSNR